MTKQHFQSIAFLLSCSVSIISLPSTVQAEETLGLGYRYGLEQINHSYKVFDDKPERQQDDRFVGSFMMNSVRFQSSLIANLLLLSVATAADLNPNARIVAVDSQGNIKKNGALNILDNELRRDDYVPLYIDYSWGQSTGIDTNIFPKSDVTNTSIKTVYSLPANSTAELTQWVFGGPIWNFDLGIPFTLGGEVGERTLNLSLLRQEGAQPASAYNHRLKNLFYGAWLRTVIGCKWLYLEPQGFLLANNSDSKNTDKALSKPSGGSLTLHFQPLSFIDFTSGASIYYNNSNNTGRFVNGAFSEEAVSNSLNQQLVQYFVGAKIGF
jgi:hypothetical protein